MYDNASLQNSYGFSKSAGRSNVRETISRPPQRRHMDVDADLRVIEPWGMISERDSRSIPNNSAIWNLRY